MEKLTLVKQRIDDYDVVRRMKAHLDESGESIKEVSKKIGAGVSSAVLSTWLRGEYTGDNAAVSDRVLRWLETQDEISRSGAGLPRLDRHVDLGVTDDIHGALAHAQATCDVVLVHGRSGAGKTQALRRFRATRSGVHIVTVTPAVASVAGMLSRVAMAVDAGAKHHSAAAAEAAIIQRLEGRSTLLVVDEAHHLSPRLLDELRCIRDVSGCGLALVGSDELWTALAGSRRCDQITGRIALRIPIGQASETDIRLLAETVLGRGLGEKELKAVRNTARGAGGLHSLRRLLVRAHMIAAAAGSRDISAEHITLALEG